MSIAQSQKTKLGSTAPAARFKQLQASLPDNRDNRGKRHNLAFVLTGLLWALLRSGGHLSISRLHRWMGREHTWLVDQTGHHSPKPISDAQLRRLLAGLSYERYNTFNDRYFGWSSSENGVWYSVDGKELRGSIDGVSGQKRGENIVRLVGHEDAQAHILGFYSGLKESERAVVETYFEQQPVDVLAGQRISLDALYTTPAMLGVLHQAGVGYVVGLKTNQSALLAQAQRVVNRPAAFADRQVEKGHRRVEMRSYAAYPLNPLWLDERCQASGIQTVIWADRERWRHKTGHITRERVCFVSNLALSALRYWELVGAIRNHWQIEADHHVRDVTGGEDKIRCKEPTRLRSVASVLNVGINLLRAYDRKGNLRACWEDCTADRKAAFNCWKSN
jgi:predicted transposase YbfD/YdcC